MPSLLIPFLSFSVLPSSRDDQAFGVPIELNARYGTKQPCHGLAAARLCTIAQRKKRWHSIVRRTLGTAKHLTVLGYRKQAMQQAIRVLERSQEAYRKCA
jgi:hypothetical protein